MGLLKLSLDKIFSGIECPLQIISNSFLIDAFYEVTNLIQTLAHS
jgi:hypothetical protein